MRVFVSVQLVVLYIFLPIEHDVQGYGNRGRFDSLRRPSLVCR